MVLTKAARIRIGRVTMKNGGADVRVLHRDQHPSPMAGQHLLNDVAARLWMNGDEWSPDDGAS